MKVCKWINVPTNDLRDKLRFFSVDESKLNIFQYGICFNEIPVKHVFNDPIIRFVSNRNWQTLYNIDIIVKAFGQLFEVQQLEGVELHIYGGGSVKDNNRIESLIRQLSPFVQSKIIVHGKTSHPKLLSELHHYDFFISIPNMDGLPLSLLEAMYAGLIPVVNFLPTYSECLDSKSAIFINNNSVKELSDKLLFAIGSRTQFDILRNRYFAIQFADHNQNTRKFLND